MNCATCRGNLVLPRFAVCIMVCFFLFPSRPSAQDKIETVLKNQLYVTRGFLSLPIAFSALREILDDYSTYREWALEGMDGKDPVSKKFIGIFSDIIYLPEQHFFEVVFDVNLPWPFGSKGNKIQFKIKEEQNDEKAKRMTLVMATTSFAVEHASLSFEAYGLSGGSVLIFTARLKFSSLIGLFFNIDSYKKNVEWRIGRMVKNLKKRVGFLYPHMIIME